MIRKLREWIEFGAALLVILMIVCLGAAVTVTEFLQRIAAGRICRKSPALAGLQQ